MWSLWKGVEEDLFHNAPRVNCKLTKTVWHIHQLHRNPQPTHMTSPLDLCIQDTEKSFTHNRLTRFCWSQLMKSTSDSKEEKRYGKKNSMCVCVRVRVLVGTQASRWILGSHVQSLNTPLLWFFPPTELFTRNAWATRRIEKLKPQAQRDCKKNLPSSALLKHETYWQVIQSTAIQRLPISYHQYYCCKSADGVEISPVQTHRSDDSCSSCL